MLLELDDIASFDADIAESFEKNAKRFIALFYAAADQVMPNPTVMHIVQDVFDVLEEHRNQLVQASRAEDAENMNDDNMAAHINPANTFPDALKRR